MKGGFVRNLSLLWEKSTVEDKVDKLGRPDGQRQERLHSGSIYHYYYKCIIIIISLLKIGIARENLNNKA